MTCLITGCNLVDAADGRWVHGDLHRIGHSYVFNACLKGGETAWCYEPIEQGSKELVVDNILAFEHQCFERRGVIVFPLVFGRLNDAAAAYLGRPPI